MLNKLAFRNARRSIRDYLVYLITMTGIAAMMFAFNSMIFSKDVKKMCEDATAMIGMLGLATFFIVIIVVWLINYIVHFMLEKRSREFGTYLLLGMKRKQISRLYMRENILIEIIGFLAGAVAGIFLQQIIMTIFFSMFSQGYRIKVEFSWWSVLMTTGCYFSCYLLALFRNKRKFKKINISELMRMEKENEQIKQGGEIVKQWFFFGAVLYFIFFFIELFKGHYSVTGVILMSVGFIIAIYVMYMGIAAFIVRYIRKGGNGVYRKQNLFIYRQLSSKLKTMKFTMGTLTILLTCALLGGTIAMMFARYENKALNNAMPFDVLVYSDNPQEDFVEETEAIEEQVGIKHKLIYHIYQNGSHEMNDFLYVNASTISSKYKNNDGTLNDKAVKKDGYEYYDYDTFIRLSDYNELRKMLGYEEISLDENEYAINIKERMKTCVKGDILNRVVNTGDKELSLSKIYTESIAQNGINGADYLIIIPDSAAEKMTPYYTNLAAGVKEEPTYDLQTELENIRHKKNGIMPEKEFDKLQESGKIKEDEIWDDITLGGCGTDQIIVMVSDVIVAVPLKNEMKFVLTAVIFPLVYIGMVFVCVALTILAVQQLSDSTKYRFRYDVLRKLGLSKREINKVVLKQLLGYYMVPGIVSLILSGMIAIFAGNNFVKYTGAMGSGIYYFGISVAIFFGVYAVYFAATYVGFKKNIQSTVNS